MIKVDFLLVGQGLAGSLLAFELIRRGFRVMVVDDGADNASKVAAGLVNPLTGPRLVKSAGVDACLPTAKRLYQELAGQFGQVFYVEKPMLRLLRDLADIKQAEQRLQTAGYSAYLSGIQPGEQTGRFYAPFGCLEQRQTGYLLIKPLLACLKIFFIATHSYRHAPFDHADLTVAATLRWRDIEALKVVFCEGHHARYNPWFSWLPFRPVKGEILDLRLESGHRPWPMLNYGHWLIPLSETEFRTGASFDFRRLDTQPTETAQNQLMVALALVSKVWAHASVIGQQAGVRPCTLDRQPFIGVNPTHPNLAIFNGFGTKGSLQIPWYSQRFADFLVGGAPPPSNISRYRIAPSNA